MSQKLSDIEIRRRHTVGHIMSYACQMLWPNHYRGVGPWTDEGVYQDYDFRGEKVSEDDFKAIEKKMRWIVNKNFKIVKKVLPESEARSIIADDPYKGELMDEILSRGEELSFYVFEDESGKAVFTDLCGGPHLASTGEVGAFKLMKIAGAYWRGDEKNPMLTRIYAVAFPSQTELDTYLYNLEEAKKRDHRKLGRELGLYTIDPTVGLGLVLWKPKGAFVLNTLRRWFEDQQLKRGYMPVITPHIGRKKLWETSGHWGYYNDSMYPPIQVGQSLADYQDKREAGEDEIYLLKPMNCPFHVSIYADDLHSYRDLPLRYYEFGTVYRYEQKGELGGLTRVRGFTQDDAHIICTPDQIEEEIRGVLDLAWFVLKETFGFEVSVYASFRDPKSDKYLGDSKNWDLAEQTIEKILKERDIPYTREEGEAAFYGPKMDFKVQDCLGRSWQLSTIQFDFNLPERFKMTYIDSDGTEKQPLMVHRALLGSMERFMGILIEHFGGAFPVWLAPVQAVLLPVADAHMDFTTELSQKIRSAGGRVEIYDPSETLGKRIRLAQTQKIPFAVILGDQETKGDNLTVREYGSEKDEKMDIDQLLKKFRN